MNAFDCLQRSNKDILTAGIEKAKLMLCNIYKTARNLLESKQVKNAGRFLYAVVPDGSTDSRLFSHPHALLMLAHYMLRAYVECSRSRHAISWPLVISAVYNADEDMCLVAGIPPVVEDQPKKYYFVLYKNI